jgi:hypothetical protein
MHASKDRLLAAQPRRKAEKPTVMTNLVQLHKPFSQPINLLPIN